MAKVVHISPRPYGLSAEAKEELKRILGEGGRITRVSPTGKSPDELVAEIRALQPDVIVMENTTPPHSRAVRSLRDEYPVLERRYAERTIDPNWRQARNPEPRTSRRTQGYGIRNERGEVEALADNALREHVSHATQGHESPETTGSSARDKQQRHDDQSEEVEQQREQQRDEQERYREDNGYGY